MKIKPYIIAICTLILTACSGLEGDEDGKFRIVTTTTIISDLMENIGGEKVTVTGLMGPGVDPHLYKASEGDVIKLFGADIIFYSGLHLEGKMADIFEKMNNQGRIAVNLGSSLAPEKLTQSENFGGNYDPHVWFDVRFFMDFARAAEKALSAYSPEDADYFKVNLNKYLEELEELDSYLHQLAESLPENKRRLVTAHDAFGYFGQAYGFDVVGLQGISTATEAGVSDVRSVTDYIVNHQVKAVFIESSVPMRTIEALQKAVQARGHELNIGGMLYSDALGSPDTDEGTYIGMFKYNMKTIVDGLK